MSRTAIGLPVRAVLFDLDGTLVDSVADLAAAVNAVLEVHGEPPLPIGAVRGMVGNGIAKLVERAFAASGRPLEGQALDEAVADMMAAYRGCLTKRTVLMPGAVDAVEALRESGLHLGLATNKPLDATRAIMDHFGLAARFGAIVGGRADLARKPAPDMLLAALTRLSVDPENAVMVGDSAIDVDAARNAGMRSILVHGGYSAADPDTLGADFIIDDLTALAEALLAPRDVTNAVA